MALATRAHVPRCTTTSLPVTPWLVYAAGLHPMLTPPVDVRRTLTVSAPFGSVAAFALSAVTVRAASPCTAGSDRLALGRNAGFTAAATAMPLRLTAGDATM